MDNNLYTISNKTHFKIKNNKKREMITAPYKQYTLSATQGKEKAERRRGSGQSEPGAEPGLSCSEAAYLEPYV